MREQDPAVVPAALATCGASVLLWLWFDYPAYARSVMLPGWVAPSTLALGLLAGGAFFAVAGIVSARNAPRKEGRAGTRVTRPAETTEARPEHEHCDLATAHPE